MNKYKILEEIGKGKFGRVYSGKHVRTGELVAIKIEDVDSDIKLLKNETTVLNYLYHNGCKKIPLVYWYGNYELNTCLIMTYYDTSLYDYTISKSPDPSRSKIIVSKIVNVIKNVHDSQIIHRDIKPQNFMIKGGELYLIDFGLATVYADDSKIHIPEKRDNMNILGTPKYSSIFIHEGSSPSRRDDIISCGYIYLFLLLGGSLPWENLPDIIQNYEYNESHIFNYKNQERFRQKSWSNLEKICQQLNSSLVYFFNNAYSLRYEDRPKYGELIL
jgi:serine/threonine protein kinase